MDPLCQKDVESPIAVLLPANARGLCCGLERSAVFWDNVGERFAEGELSGHYATYLSAKVAPCML